MITLQKFLEVINYRVTEGSEYQWECYGPDAFGLDSWDHDYNGISFNIIFDRVNQTVFQVEAHDFANRRSYRYINPDFAKQHREEAQARGVSYKEAYDEVDFVDLETEEDWISKATAIANYQPYDTRVSVPIDLSHDELFTLMTMAHERDITLNQLVAEVLTVALEHNLENIDG